MGSLYAMTWRYQTRALTCSAPWPQMAVSPGAGGSSMASWRTGPNPAFFHWLHSARSSLPSWCLMLSPRHRLSPLSGISTVGPGAKWGPAKCLPEFPVSCLTHQENTLCQIRRKRTAGSSSHGEQRGSSLPWSKQAGLTPLDQRPFVGS